MTRAQKKRTNREDDHKGGPNRHLADWTGTPFKYISQRGNHYFKVRLTVKKGHRIIRVFRSLVDAQDFVTSSGFDLTEKTAQKAKA